jgi:hypothetical protein
VRKLGRRKTLVRSEGWTAAVLGGFQANRAYPKLTPGLPDSRWELTRNLPPAYRTAGGGAGIMISDSESCLSQSSVYWHVSGPWEMEMMSWTKWLLLDLASGSRAVATPSPTGRDATTSAVYVTALSIAFVLCALAPAARATPIVFDLRGAEGLTLDGQTSGTAVNKDGVICDVHAQRSRRRCIQPNGECLRSQRKSGGR